MKVQQTENNKLHLNKREQTKNLCIIPARGGSKRIPRKNIKAFLGKPIIAYSIQVAKDSGLFDEIMVSTDDKEIADIAQMYGAEIPFYRSPKNADDFATTIDVVKEVVNEYKKNKLFFNGVCVLYPTAPFVSVSCLEKGYESLNIYDAAIPVVEYDFPVWRSFRISDNLLRYQWPEFEKSRSQDLESLYHDAGQWYWIKTDKIDKTLVPEKTAPILLNRTEVQDIDNEEDWDLAELKYKLIQEKKLS